MTRAARNSAFQLLADFGSRAGNVRAGRETPENSPYEEGYLKGLAEARAEAETDRMALAATADEALQTRLADERAAWQRDCAELMKSELETAIGRVEQRLGDRIAILLKPWLGERLHEKAMADFEHAIERAMGEGTKLHIEGPPDLLASFREVFPVELLQVSFSESARCGVSAHIEETQIDLDVAAWVAGLEGEAR